MTLVARLTLLPSHWCSTVCRPGQGDDHLDCSKATSSPCHPERPSTAPSCTSRCEGSPKPARLGWEILRVATLAQDDNPGYALQGRCAAYTDFQRMSGRRSISS